MKKTLFILGAVTMALIIFVSCRHDPKVEVTSMEVDPTAITLKPGDTKQLKVTWTPQTAKVNVVFTSNKPDIATVTADGIVKAVSEGIAAITVNVGEQKAVCSVTVAPEANQNKNELPLLRFGFEPVDTAIAAYEKSLGRVLKQEVLLISDKGTDKYRGLAYVGDLKTIPVVAYYLQRADRSSIVALGTEAIDNCPRTLDMLKELGFSDVRVVEEQGKKFIRGEKDDNNNIYIEGEEQKITGLKGQPDTQIIISFMKMKEMLPREHPCLIDAKDFPSWSEFLTKDTNRIKAYEEKIGFRAFNFEDSNETRANLMFETYASKRSSSNITWVSYNATPSSGNPPSINAQVNCIDNPNQLESTEVRTWLALNGFDTDFKKVSKGWYYVWNSDKSAVLQIFTFDSKCMLQIFPGDFFNEETAKELRAFAIGPQNILFEKNFR